MKKITMAALAFLLVGMASGTSYWVGGQSFDLADPANWDNGLDMAKTFNDTGNYAEPLYLSGNTNFTSIGFSSTGLDAVFDLDAGGPARTLSVSGKMTFYGTDVAAEFRSGIVNVTEIMLGSSGKSFTGGRLRVSGAQIASSGILGSYYADHRIEILDGGSISCTYVRLGQIYSNATRTDYNNTLVASNGTLTINTGWQSSGYGSNNVVVVAGRQGQITCPGTSGMLFSGDYTFRFVLPVDGYATVPVNGTRSITLSAGTELWIEGLRAFRAACEDETTVPLFKVTTSNEGREVFVNEADLARWNARLPAGCSLAIASGGKTLALTAIPPPRATVVIIK